MATWQADCELLPRVFRAGAVDGATVIRPAAGTWRTREELSQRCPAFDDWLPRDRADADVWGGRDETCASVIEDEELGISVYVRSDLRTATPALLARLLSIVRDCDLVIRLLETGELCSTKEELVHALKASSAYRFVCDLMGFIRELHEREEGRQA